MPVKSKESVSHCEISLDIEVESAKVAGAVDKAYREFSKYIAVPGFRKGKAPMSFVKQRVPSEQLRERTAEILVGPAFEEAISESDIKPYAQPRMELVKLETGAPDYAFEFKAIVPLPPEVKLGQYKGIAVERERHEVTDGEVDRQIESVRDRAAEYPVVEDRPAQMGDIVVGELSVTPDGVETQGEFKQTAITLGALGNLPGVEDELMGIAKGEEREFDLTFPDDYDSEELAGSPAHFVMRVSELHTKVLPDIDDAFAVKYGGAETADEMRLKIRTEMQKTQLEMAEAAAESKLMDIIVETSTINYPSVLLDLELEDDIKTFREDIEKRDMTVQEYLERSGTTEEDLLGQFRSRAEMKLKRGLVLGEVTRQENLQLTEQDVDAEIERRAVSQRRSPQSYRAFVDSSGGMEAIRNAAYTRKVLGFLASSAVITDKVAASNADDVVETAPAAKAEAEVKPKAVKPRKKKEETSAPETV